jgi:coenzyme F420-reducing hydrogenase gamma subunit
MSRISCPNCNIPCTGCAGARLTVASDGTRCCTKCLPSVEQKIKARQLDKNKK